MIQHTTLYISRKSSYVSALSTQTAIKKAAANHINTRRTTDKSTNKHGICTGINTAFESAVFDFRNMFTSADQASYIMMICVNPAIYYQVAEMSVLYPIEQSLVITGGLQIQCYGISLYCISDER